MKTKEDYESLQFFLIYKTKFHISGKIYSFLTLFIKNTSTSNNFLQQLFAQGEKDFQE